jgi:hypothetical protein
MGTTLWDFEVSGRCMKMVFVYEVDECMEG